jgi:anti-anti-sigma factor
MAGTKGEPAFTLVEVEGVCDSLDEARIADFQDMLLLAAERADPPVLLLDLAGARFVGSAFLAVVIRAWKRLRDRQGKLLLCNPDEPCASVLSVSKLDTIWDIYPSRDQALRALAAPLP